MEDIKTVETVAADEAVETEIITETETAEAAGAPEKKPLTENQRHFLTATARAFKVFIARYPNAEYTDADGNKHPVTLQAVRQHYMDKAADRPKGLGSVIITAQRIYRNYKRPGKGKKAAAPAETAEAVAEAPVATEG